MNVTIFLRGLGLGGVERCAALVGEGLAARGVNVTLVTLGDATNRWQARTGNLRVVDLSQTWHPKKPWTWLAGWRAARALAQQSDVLIAATFLMPLYMAWAATRGLPTRLIGWVHGPLGDLDRAAKMNPVHRFACQSLYRKLPELIFVSKHARASMARWLARPEQPHWQVIPNFVEDALLRPPHYPGKPLQLLFVGRVDVEKQPSLWLDTLAALVQKNTLARLTVVGDGPLLGWLQSEASRRGLALLLECVGARDDVGAFMQRADFLLLTSWFEGCPLVVLEAMKAGLPVVSTNAGGVVELFDDHAADFVVDTASGEALASKILAQVPAHPALSARLKLRSHAFDAPVLLDRWASLLQTTPATVVSVIAS